MLAYRYSCLLAFLTGLAVTYFLTPWVRTLALRLGAVDRPNERRPHKHPTPRGGGLAVVLGVHIACLVALALAGLQTAGGLALANWAPFALASLVLLLTGILDDLRGLPPLLKLGGQMIAALFIWLSNTRFGTLFGYPLPPSLDCVLVVLWLLAVINAFNLIDGLDGLASGLAIISAVGLCGISALGHLTGDVLVLVALIGACIGFLRYNFHPASIFLGDTGSMFLGFTLGVVSLRTLTKSTFILSLAIPLMVLGVPIYDEVLAVWRRAVRQILAGVLNSPIRHGLMQPDLDHLHHRLLKAGLSTRRVGTLLFLLNAALVVVGLLITAFQSRAMGIFLLGLLALVYILFRHLAVIELRDTGTVLLAGLRRPTHATARALGLPVWDMLCLSGAAALTMGLLESPQPRFWHAWFLDLPVWVTPTFSLLALSRLYFTVWTRARTRDVLTLIGTLLAGLLTSLGIQLLIYPGHPAQCLAKALLIGGLSHPAILALRIGYRSAEELVLSFRYKSERTSGTERVVLYGAGARCQLFLKERTFRAAKPWDGREIVGLLDDEPSLHAQWVYGYPVLGSMANLPQLIARHHFSGIVITAALVAPARQNICQLARRYHLHLTEWHFGEAELLPPPTELVEPLSPAVSGATEPRNTPVVSISVSP